MLDLTDSKTRLIRAINSCQYSVLVLGEDLWIVESFRLAATNHNKPGDASAGGNTIVGQRLPTMLLTLPDKANTEERLLKLLDAELAKLITEQLTFPPSQPWEWWQPVHK